MRVKPVAAEANATITVNGAAVVSGNASQAISLNVGTNNITVLVTAQDGVTTNTYTITVVRQGLANANLTALRISAGTLSPVFASGTYNYTASVSGSVTSVKVTPTAADASSAIKVNGTTVASGTASPAIPLSPGANTINVAVTSHDGSTTITYTITVTQAGSSNSKLAALSLNSGVLSPVFDPATTSYSASVPSNTTNVQVTPAVAEAHATITVNGSAVASGQPSQSIQVHTGNNPVTIVVTAQDHTTTTYSINVIRAKASNANLFSLLLSDGAVSPAFDGGTTSYSATIHSGTVSITVTPYASNPAAAITVNGAAVTSATASPALPMATGTNTVTVIVTSPDGTATRTYTVSVLRPSSNANLSALSLSTGTISPAFSQTTTAYTASVSNTVSAIRVKPVAANGAATIQVNGAAVVSGGASQPIPLNAGANTITTVVTAQNGTTTKSYTITVTRAASPSNNPAYASVGVNQPVSTPALTDGIVVHRALSPNGDGVNDALIINGLENFPENKLQIIDRSGALVYEATGYNNGTKLFDGHSNKTGKLQLPGTYFYALDYSRNGVTKHVTGFIVLKY